MTFLPFRRLFAPWSKSNAVWALASLLAGLALSALLFPGMAFAQTSAGPFSPPANDLSKTVFIDYLFGPLTTGATSPLTSMVQVFNSAILLIGGIIITYTMIAGTVQTAHDGEMLGKRWSSIWLPLRTALGAGAVLPVIGSGWCVAQAIVIWLALQGVGLADTMWGTFVDKLAQADNLGAFYNPPSAYRQVRQTFGDMLVANTCVAAHQKYPGSSLMNSPVFVAETGNEGGYIYGTLQDVKLGKWSDPACGALLFTGVNYSGASAGGGGGSTDDSVPNSEVGNSLINMDILNAQVLQAQRAEFAIAQNNLASLAVDLANNNTKQEAVDHALDVSVQSYINDISGVARSAYRTAFTKNGGFVDTMKKDGWIMAGAYYMEIAKAQDAITRSVTTIPIMNGTPMHQIVSSAEKSMQSIPGPLGVGAQIGSWMRNKLKEAETPDEVTMAIARASSMVHKASFTCSGGSGSSGCPGGVQSKDPLFSGDSVDSSFGDRLLSAFVDNQGAWWSNGNALTQNPVMMAKGIGDTMVTSAWAAFGAAEILALSGTGAVAGGAAAMAAGPLTLLFSALLIPGALLSTYLPLLPYILWLGVVLGWFILLVEAVIAAPLWAIMHLAPDGDGLTGRGGNGYMLVLSLMLRPSLMIFGLGAAFALMKPVGYLVNSTFVGAFVSNVSNGAIGVTQSIAGAFIYAMVMYTIINRVFALIHVIPDRILRWIGGGGGELGQEAENLAGGARSVAAIESVRTLAQTTSQGIRDYRMNNINEDQRNAQNRDAERNRQAFLGERVTSASMTSGSSLKNAEQNPGSVSAQEDALIAANGMYQTAEAVAVDQAKYAAENGSPAAQAQARQFLREYDVAKARGGADMDGFVEKWSGEAGGGQPFQQSMISMRMAGQRILTAQDGLASASSSIAAARAASQGKGGAPDDSGPGGGSGGGGSRGGPPVTDGVANASESREGAYIAANSPGQVQPSVNPELSESNPKDSYVSSARSKESAPSTIPNAPLRTHVEAPPVDPDRGAKGSPDPVRTEKDDRGIAGARDAAPPWDNKDA